LLRSQPAPPSRNAHFAAVLNHPDYRFRGWQLEIIEVKSAQGSTTAKVRATPMISGSRQSATALGAMHEVYEIHNRTLKLLRSEGAGTSAGVAAILD
jgi:hypothetical protein